MSKKKIENIGLSNKEKELIQMLNHPEFSWMKLSSFINTLKSMPPYIAPYIRIVINDRENVFLSANIVITFMHLTSNSRLFKLLYSGQITFNSAFIKCNSCIFISSFRSSSFMVQCRISIKAVIVMELTTAMVSVVLFGN